MHYEEREDRSDRHPQELITNPTNDFVKNFVGNKHDSWSNDFQLKDLLEPIIEKEDQVSAPITTTMQEIVDMLVKYEQVIIERDGTPIGLVNRRSMMKYVSSRLLQKGV